MNEHLREAVNGARFPHPRYVEAVRSAAALMTFSGDGSVIAMVGPPRAGKSTAGRAAAREVYPHSTPDSIPYVVVDCSRTDAGYMSMRYLTLDLLAQLGHPFYGDLEHSLRLKLTETNARLQLRRAIEYRRTKLLIIDEAHHLLRVKDRSGREAALESLKCLGNETGALIFLIGGYELLRECFCSAHMNGRLSILHFPRYGTSISDAGCFDRILASYDVLLPWAKGHSLLEMRDLLYEGSLGSCGLVGNWILLALARMTSLRSQRLRMEHFRSARYKQQLAEIAEDITFGESALQSIEKDHTSIFELTSITDVSERKAARRPGKRIPTRDPVGNVERRR
ncbi:ATP-binding protein [Stenotrophomonas maltophilia]|uniref:ATP-binding protein n=1 Tax=Stenotrophomonas maltophilia TaxID=40324 RepID=UPI0039C1F579